jgi:PhnB protein
MTKPIPDGYHALTPSLVVDGGVEALDFYRRAFGAEVVRKLEIGGKIMFAELRIGDSLFTLCDPMPDYGFAAPGDGGNEASSLLIYCEDVDALNAQAVAAGAEQINPPSDQFHGDRAGSVRDPFGHRWALATHTEDMSEEEMQRRTEEAMAGM